ncbi:hypothetical protein K505DRAFT_365833 [Melanomma pulvis-pyrius CBS 109.77]|uniref:Uncharacterized protein n=1 Tax=Melanomma pulvis-pyrius CBS 109.77 TaxID=1314802 RepID=A0A6A6WYL3_9PLEO|nr:hypothetical protein K505DRAFT_365833 [Melanomma pulvis-pyrius CBS 109.77]
MSQMDASMPLKGWVEPNPYPLQRGSAYDLGDQVSILVTENGRSFYRDFAIRARRFSEAKDTWEYQLTEIGGTSYNSGAWFSEIRLRDRSG